MLNKMMGQLFGIKIVYRKLMNLNSNDNNWFRWIYIHTPIGGDEAGTIFIVYAGTVMKIDPSDGSEIWTDIWNTALVESSDGYIYSAGTGWGRRFEYN